MTVDGRAIFDNDDYKLSLGVTKEKLGYARFSLYAIPHLGQWRRRLLPAYGDVLSAVGQTPWRWITAIFPFEAGLTLDNLPKVTFKYEHTFREGSRVRPVGATPSRRRALTHGLSPSFYDINEHSDIFQLDVTHHIKATDFGVGLRYETGKMDDALKTTQFPGEAIRAEDHRPARHHL